MKVLVIASLFALATAAPQVSQLSYRNLYKQPIVSVGHNHNTRIIGGQEAEPNSIPWQVFLEIYNTTTGWYCGGSLISANYVVTAAHCAVDGIQVYVHLGTHTPLIAETNQVQIISTAIKIHEEYDSKTIENDIAIIGLPNGVELSTIIQPVKLPPGLPPDYSDQSARASGWGFTSADARFISDVLFYVDLIVMKNKQCEEFFGFLPTSVLCTFGDANSGTCNGDSGGPLVLDGTLIGISSFEAKGCPGGSPSGFTRVSSFVLWLADHTDVDVNSLGTF